MFSWLLLQTNKEQLPQQCFVRSTVSSMFLYTMAIFHSPSWSSHQHLTLSASWNTVLFGFWNTAFLWLSSCLSNSSFDIFFLPHLPLYLVLKCPHCSVVHPLLFSSVLFKYPLHMQLHILPIFRSSQIIYFQPRSFLWAPDLYIQLFTWILYLDTLRHFELTCLKLHSCSFLSELVFS